MKINELKNISNPRLERWQAPAVSAHPASPPESETKPPSDFDPRSTPILAKQSHRHHARDFGETNPRGDALCSLPFGSSSGRAGACFNRRCVAEKPPPSPKTVRRRGGR